MSSRQAEQRMGELSKEKEIKGCEVFYLFILTFLSNSV